MSSLFDRAKAFLDAPEPPPNGFVALRADGWYLLRKGRPDEGPFADADEAIAASGDARGIVITTQANLDAILMLHREGAFDDDE